MSHAARKDPTYSGCDDVRQELLDTTRAAVSSVHDVVQRLSVVAEQSKRESRMLRREAQKTAMASRSGLKAVKPSLSKQG